jgi:hypothetical protein
VYRPVRCLFEFALLQMSRILDVRLLLYSCARGQGRLNRTERTIFYCSVSRDIDRMMHISRHTSFVLFYICRARCSVDKSSTSYFVTLICE